MNENSVSKSLILPLFLGLCVLAALQLADALMLIPDRGGDFRAFYSSALDWRQGLAPYTTQGIDPLNPIPPNLTPPAMLLVFAPLTWLPFPVALSIWTLVSLACLISSIIISRHHIGLSLRDAIVVVLAASPTALALGLGQITFVLMLFMTLAWIATLRKRRSLAGALLGFVCFVKPFYGLFFLWLVWRRDWRGALALLSTVFTGLLVSFVLVGAEQFMNWLILLQDISWQAHIYNASIIGLGERLFGPPVELLAVTWTPLLVSLAVKLTVVIIFMAAVTGSILLLLFRSHNAKELDSQALQAESISQVHNVFTGLSAAGLLLAPLAWIHYLPVSAAPTLAVLARRHRWWGGAVLLLAVWPYQALINTSYGILGTITVGLWAPGMAMLILVATLCERYQHE